MNITIITPNTCKSTKTPNKNFPVVCHIWYSPIFDVIQLFILHIALVKEIVINVHGFIVYFDVLNTYLEQNFKKGEFRVAPNKGRV